MFWSPHVPTSYSATAGHPLGSRFGRWTAFRGRFVNYMDPVLEDVTAKKTTGLCAICASGAFLLFCFCQSQQLQRL